MADGFFGKVKMLIGVEEEEPEEEIVYEEPVPARRQRAAGESRSLDRPSYDRPSYDLEDRSRAFVAPKIETRESKVLSMQNSSSTSGAGKRQQFKMVVTMPKSFDECPKLVDNLRNKKPVIINLETLPTEVARKIFDFLSGATYALDGNVQKVADSIFIFAPENVDVTASVQEKSSGMASLGDRAWNR